MNSERSASAELERLVEKVRRGDRNALELLFATHRQYLRQVVGLRMDDALRVRVDPSDIVQDAQLEAMRRVDEYARDPKLPVRLWMRQIAVDRLIMAQRRHIASDKRSVRRECALPENSSVAIAQQLVAGIAPPSAAAVRSEIACLVRRSVAQLDDGDHQIVMLLAFEGLNSGEAGQVLGIEAATARKRFGRALLRLRELLIESGLGGSES